MTLKTKTHDVERVSTVQRTSERTLQTASKHECCPHHDVLQRAITSPSSALRPKDVFALQRTVGNRAVRQILQAKLAVGPAHDHYEREADRVAASVMSKSAAPKIQRQGLEEDETIQTKSLASTITPLIQRQELSEEEENSVQTKSDTVQRQETPTEEDENDSPVQLKRDGGPTSVTSGVENAIDRARGGGQALPDKLRSHMERSFGADFGAVRVHSDSDSDTLNRSLHARAFTTGHDVFFRGGEYNPDSRRGQELIAHELTHVVQQNGGTSGKKNLSLKRSTSTVIQRNWFDELLGKYDVDTKGKYGNIKGIKGEKGRRQNYNEDMAPDVVNYSLLGAGVGSAFAKGATDKGNIFFTTPKDLFTENTPLLSKTGEAISWMGAVSAGAGTATSLIDAYKGVAEYRDTAKTKEQQRIGLGAGVSGLTSATQQAATTAFHSANLVANPAMAATAELVTGGAGIATGTVDILRGAYAYSKAKQNVERLKNLQNESQYARIRTGARQAKSTQQMRQSNAKFTVAKGVLTAVGGGLLVASAATPIGWLLLGVGAFVGGIGALLKLYNKQKRKEEVAKRALGVSDIDMWKWENEVKAIKSKHRIFTDARKNELAKLGPSPLDKKLQEKKFVSVGHYYANYIHKTANDIYDLGIEAREDLEDQGREFIAKKRFTERTERQALENLRKMSTLEEISKWSRSQVPEKPGHVYGEIEKLLSAMGLKADFGKTPPEPKPEKIGKALHD